MMLCNTRRRSRFRNDPHPIFSTLRDVRRDSHRRLKTTDYFEHTRRRRDRARIRDAWVELAVRHPVAEKVQSDGRIQRWAFIPEEQRYLRVILLEDGETIHNAFFDRRFRP